MRFHWAGIGHWGVWVSKSHGVRRFLDGAFRSMRPFPSCKLSYKGESQTTREKGPRGYDGGQSP